MPTVKVVYTGHAPAVEGGGFLFARGEEVEVPKELAERLGSAFRIVDQPETKKRS